MHVIGWDDFVSGSGHGPAAATIGVFDGFHRGHQRLVSTIVEKSPALRPVVVTFIANPKRVLYPESFLGNIFDLEQKLDALSMAGVYACVLIDFSRNFGTLSGAEFLGLLSKAGVKSVCVGPNFKCGHDMDTGARDLARIGSALGMDALIAEPVVYEGVPISSSRIRTAIMRGRVEDASAMLGRPFALRPCGTVRRAGEFCEFAMDPDAVRPQDGSYRVLVDDDDGGSDGRVETLALVSDGRLQVRTGREEIRSVSLLAKVSRE